jgi:hypothetical protein
MVHITRLMIFGILSYSELGIVKSVIFLEAATF